MKKSILCISLLIGVLLVTNVKAQVGIVNATPNPASPLAKSSTSKGFLVPRLTKTQRDAITSVTAAKRGLLIYQSYNIPGCFYAGTVWSSLAGSFSYGNAEHNNPFTI